MNEVETARPWLSPCEALSRFEMPDRPGQDRGPDTQEARVRYGFRVGNIGLLLAHDAPSEVIERPSVFAFPNTQPCFLGMANLRGNVVPVYDLDILFDLDSTGDDKGLLLVVGKGEQAVGIAIAALPEPQRLEDGHVVAQLPPLPRLLQPHVIQGHVIDARIWLEFHHEGLFQAISHRAGER